MSTTYSQREEAMSKQAREYRATVRRDDRYVEGRAKPDDFDAAVFGWNKAKSRSLKKWAKHQDQLLFTSDEEYQQWLFLGLWRPLVKGARKKP
jgi:hypothetical protein